VHSFANDPERGVFLLLILGAFIGGSLTLYAWRAPTLRSTAVFATVSRESGLIVNNLLLVVATFVVFIGTIWPLLVEVLTGRKVSVGAPFFDLAFTPFMMAIAVVLPVLAILPWKRGNLGRAIRQLRGPLALALALGVLTWSVQTGRSALAPIGATLAAWLVLGAFAEIAVRIRLAGAPPGESLRRAWNLPRADWGKALAHAGLGVTIFGVAAITAWATEDIRVARPGESFAVGRYALRLDSVVRERGPNYDADIATVAVLEGGTVVTTLHPEKRLYEVQGMATTEAGIDRGFTRDLYVALGDPQAGGWALRTYVKPFSNWIWLGAMIMAAGGLTSLTDRRYRVGAPARRETPDAVPAE
jgi:cytochrome c-type biogenesis protein CcmF